MLVFIIAQVECDVVQDIAEDGDLDSVAQPKYSPCLNSWVHQFIFIICFEFAYFIMLFFLLVVQVGAHLVFISVFLFSFL